MGRDLGGVLVVDDAQLERVGVVQANVVVGCSVLFHWLAMRGVWSGFWMAVPSGTLINRQPARDLFYSVLVIVLYFGKPATRVYISRTSMDVILFLVKFVEQIGPLYRCSSTTTTGTLEVNKRQERKGHPPKTPMPNDDDGLIHGCG
jgi:hypothetical protein